MAWTYYCYIYRNHKDRQDSKHLKASVKIQEDLEKLEQWVEAFMMNLNRDI